MIMVFKKIIKEKSGLILIVTLWILLILTLFALGMAKSVNLDLILSRYGIDKLKSYYLAKAAVIAAIAELDNDSQDAQTKDFDSLYKCGISLGGGKTPEDLFKEIKLGDGFFTMGYYLAKDKIIYGLEDEERKINLNGITIANYKVFVSLMKILGIDTDTASTIASSVVDWRDSDSNVFNPPYGAEDSYYSTLEAPYHCQNTNFQSIGELLLVRGMTQEIFQKMKDYIAIFPLQANSAKNNVNVNTAGEAVLQALANTAVEFVPGTNQADADNLVQKIIDYRKGDDKIIATADDQSIDLSRPDQLGLNPPERNLFNYLINNFFVVKSDYFKIKAQGIYKDKKVKSNITAVIKRGEEGFYFWHED